MRRVAVLLIAAGLAGCAHAVLSDGPTEVAPDRRVTRLAARAWIVRHAEPFPANSLLVEMDDGTLVLCGSPYTAEATRALLGWARKAFGTRPIVAINTHFHPDALGGNEALIEAGGRVYGSELTARLLAERGEAVRALLIAFAEKRPGGAGAFRTARWLPATSTFRAVDGLELAFGGERLEVFYPGPAHSPDNVVVWFPERHLLFGGCMILAGERLGNTADADLERWPEAIEQLRRFDAALVVPGHGDRFGPELLDRTLEVLRLR